MLIPSLYCAQHNYSTAQPYIGGQNDFFIAVLLYCVFTDSLQPAGLN